LKKFHQNFVIGLCGPLRAVSGKALKCYIVIQVRNRLKLHRGIPLMPGIHGSLSTVSN